MLLGCALRRSELAALDCGHVPQRDGRWGMDGIRARIVYRPECLKHALLELRGFAKLHPAGETMNADVLILQKFRGLYDTGLSRAHPQGLGLDFIRAPSIDDLIRFHKDEDVIRNEESFHRFIAHIPDKVMDFVPSPSTSDDPLLRRPEIDFDKHMVLVIISHEPNRFIDLDIVRIDRTLKALEVLCQYSKPGPVVQKVISYGAYCAVVTRRFDGEVVFVPHPEKLSR